jgi:hypothetical protein
MIRFPTNQLILEGPDLSGKTSLFSQIHKETNYKWNIQDRSALSMCVYAKLYGRNEFNLKENLNMSIKNLNNRFVICLPTWEEISKRFTVRGDEIQNLISLRSVYKLFNEAVEELGNYPNVIVVNEGEIKDISGIVSHVIERTENMSLNEVAQYVKRFVKHSPNYEASNLSLTLYDDGKFSESDTSVLSYEKEKEYYEMITHKTLSKIQNELDGKNEYNKKQDLNSRRFVFSDDSCISFAQFLYRNNLFDCHFVLRSSDVDKTFHYDLNFLYILAKKAYEKLKLKNVTCRLRINFNSPHIIIHRKGE